MMLRVTCQANELSHISLSFHLGNFPKLFIKEYINIKKELSGLSSNYRGIQISKRKNLLSLWFLIWEIWPRTHKNSPLKLKLVFHTWVCAFFYILARLQLQDSLGFPTVIPIALLSCEVAVGFKSEWKTATDLSFLCITALWVPYRNAGRL